MRKVIVGIAILAVTAGLFGQANPPTQRNYMLVFNVIDYTAQMKEAVTHFFNNVLQPGDQLIVVTPAKFLGFSPQKLQAPKSQLIDGILGQLKNDISMGSVKYRTTIEEMKGVVQELSGASPSAGSSAQDVLVNYSQLRQSLSVLRQDLEEKLMKYVDIFRRVKGENHLLMFFEKEFRPIPDKNTMGILRENRSTSFKAAEAFTEEQYKTGLDLQRLIAGFKYAKVRFHFLYLQGKTVRSRRGVDYVENSGDIYDIFSRLASATGGIKLASARTSAFVKQVDQVVEGEVEVEVVDQTMEKKEEKEEEKK